MGLFIAILLAIIALAIVVNILTAIYDSLTTDPNPPERKCWAHIMPDCPCKNCRPLDGPWGE